MGSKGEFEASDPSELRASADFCRFARAGIWRCGFEDCELSWGAAPFSWETESGRVEVEGPRLCLCGEETERRLMERRRFPRSMLCAEWECRCARFEDFELVRVGIRVGGRDVSLPLGGRLWSEDFDVSSGLGVGGSGVVGCSAIGVLILIAAAVALAVEV